MIWAVLNLVGKQPCANDKLGRLVMMREKVLGQDLISEEGNESTGDGFRLVDLMSFKTSSWVTAAKDDKTGPL